MRPEIVSAINELLKSIDQNAPKVRAQIEAHGELADDAVVISASKYYAALNRLAEE